VSRIERDAVTHRERIAVYFRLYKLRDEKIKIQPAFIEADSDAAAIEQAMQLLDGDEAELWQGERLVSRLSAHAYRAPTVLKS
jgi:hypothetical protein